MNWKYEGEDVLNIPSEVYGFIYLIEYTDGTKYIGKKNCFTYTKKNFGKKRLAKVIDRRLKTYETVIKESNWRSYNGSTKLSMDKTISDKQILMFCNNKTDLTYYEAVYLFYFDVLFDESFLNANILGKFYAGQISGSKEYIK